MQAMVEQRHWPSTRCSQGSVFSSRMQGDLSHRLREMRKIHSADRKQPVWVHPTKIGCMLSAEPKSFEPPLVDEKARLAWLVASVSGAGAKGELQGNVAHTRDDCMSQVKGTGCHLGASSFEHAVHMPGFRSWLNKESQR